LAAALARVAVVQHVDALLGGGAIDSGRFWSGNVETAVHQDMRCGPGVWVWLDPYDGAGGDRWIGRFCRDGPRHGRLEVGRRYRISTRSVPFRDQGAVPANFHDRELRHGRCRRRNLMG
jgi:hypothetical protein